MATTTRPRRSQRERSETTTRQLVDAGRVLFARDGYAATSIDAVVSECGVTKGALYHHFADKRELFEAVFEAEQANLAEVVSAAFSRKKDPFRGAEAGLKAYMDASLDPGVQQITLLDAPSVLGWYEMREIESRYALTAIEEALRSAVAGGRPKRDIDTLAHLLLGALCEGAMLMARASDQRATSRKVQREINGLVASLKS